MFPVHLFVQLAEVVVIGSFQELTPSVRGTISMFATVVVDFLSYIFNVSEKYKDYTFDYGDMAVYFH